MVIRVVVADDHPVLLAGMECLLSAISDVSVAGLAKNSTELVDLLALHDIDVALIDFCMPEGKYGDGIALLRFLMRRFPRIRLVVVTGVESVQVLQNIQKITIDVIVSKADHHDCLEAAIRYAYYRNRYLSPEIHKLLEQGLLQAKGKEGMPLSKREMEVLRMYAEGCSVIDIGKRVGRSRKTISSQKISAMRKLGLQTDSEIYAYAMASGLIVSTQVSRCRS
ncbi:DNA-binding response regulator [Dyella flava]|uniref:Response regulator transcription factor n=1 Tax=Dyella flava TaxID=1920170 RepID=A0ABS2K8J0_9GAMM|nr:response regulator transcription factor [Dyella flava]GLQ50147.1 DNA-binding response regulator [Dyella flava]